ncbi:hypothetical protein NGRA_1577 [Nosema granulosis]|uniref:Uncharacterized protein n=1 Tax=Nosema granulosis TaxID=83296 RepID=A0A9P6GYP0_9MICR|nr:hypothetical protein NGRA_1577 [Nosema granulosis]
MNILLFITSSSMAPEVPTVNNAFLLESKFTLTHHSPLLNQYRIKMDLFNTICTKNIMKTSPNFQWPIGIPYSSTLAIRNKKDFGKEELLGLTISYNIQKDGENYCNIVRLVDFSKKCSDINYIYNEENLERYTIFYLRELFKNQEGESIHPPIGFPYKQKGILDIQLVNLFLVYYRGLCAKKDVQKTFVRKIVSITISRYPVGSNTLDDAFEHVQSVLKNIVTVFNLITKEPPIYNIISKDIDISITISKAIEIETNLDKELEKTCSTSFYKHNNKINYDLRIFKNGSFIIPIDEFNVKEIDMVEFEDLKIYYLNINQKKSIEEIYNIYESEN